MHKHEYTSPTIGMSRYSVVYPDQTSRLIYNEPIYISDVNTLVFHAVETVWSNFLRTYIYAARIIPTVCQNIENVDTAVSFYWPLNGELQTNMKYNMEGGL